MKAFTGIEQIRAHNFVGDYYSDDLAFNAIDDFVLNENNSLADCAEAIRLMSKEGLGCEETEKDDAKLVSEHRETIREMRDV